MGEVYISSLPLAIDLIDVSDNQIEIEHPIRFGNMMREWSPKEMKLNLHHGGAYVFKYLGEALSNSVVRTRSFILVLREESI